MRHFNLLAAAVLLSACAATSTYRQSIVAEPGAKLERGKAIAIATPYRGQYDDTVYATSGRTTAAGARAAFARFSDRIRVSEKCSDVACLKGETAGGSDYLVIPEILRWEDHGDESTVRRNRIEIKMTIYGRQGAQPLASTIVSGTSQRAILGGEHAQDMLTEALNAYVETLYWQPECASADAAPAPEPAMRSPARNLDLSGCGRAFADSSAQLSRGSSKSAAAGAGSHPDPAGNP